MCYEKVVEFLLLASQREQNNIPKTIIHVKWNLLAEGHYKLNLDGALKDSHGLGGLGGIFRNHNGEWVGGFSCKVHWTNPLLEELQALHKALTMVVERKLVPLEVETDYLKLISVLDKGNHLYKYQILDCRCLMQVLEVPQVMHIYREQNTTADALARKEGCATGGQGQPNLF